MGIGAPTLTLSDPADVHVTMVTSPASWSTQTVRFKNELVRNITIKLGYANAKVSASGPLLLLVTRMDVFE